MKFTALTKSRLSRAIHLVFSLIGVSASAQTAISANTSTALAERSADGAIVPLGKLDGFWRYSAALGPFHEDGHGLDVVPDCMLHGDFPYSKRPYARESLFADHLSMVRILGGFSDEGKEGAAVQQRDLAYRDASGKIHYRIELLEPRLKPYLDNGYTDLTIVLDNVPWCFPEKPESVYLGQKSPPRDAQEWSALIQQVCRELVRIMGREQANRLRFRVGTVNGIRIPIFAAGLTPNRNLYDYFVHQAISQGFRIFANPAENNGGKRIANGVLGEKEDKGEPVIDNSVKTSNLINRIKQFSTEYKCTWIDPFNEDGKPGKIWSENQINTICKSLKDSMNGAELVGPCTYEI